MKYALIVGLGCLLLLISCNQLPKDSSFVTPTHSNTSSETGSTTNTPSVSQTPVESSSPSPSESPKKIEISYRMNKNYDIVPIDSSENAKVVLLTFDDGPKTLELNQAIIDTLKKHQAKAIFFLNGYLVKRNPEIVKLLVDHGQIIGNHSYDHIDLKKQTNEVIDFQIVEVQRLVEEITNERPKFFRPPFGSKNDYVREQVLANDMLLMNWSNGSMDWEMSLKKNDPQKVIDEVLGQLRNGSNILMHELPWTSEALDELLTEIKLRGYEFVDPNAIDTTLDPYANP